MSSCCCKERFCSQPGAPTDLFALIEIQFLPSQSRQFSSSLTPWFSSLWTQAWKLGRRFLFSAAPGHEISWATVKNHILSEAAHASSMSLPERCFQSFCSLPVGKWCVGQKAAFSYCLVILSKVTPPGVAAFADSPQKNAENCGQAIHVAHALWCSECYSQLEK